MIRAGQPIVAKIGKKYNGWQVGEASNIHNAESCWLFPCALENHDTYDEEAG